MTREVAQARIRAPLANLRGSPHPYGERVSQGLLGERVLVLGQRGPWRRVLLPGQPRVPGGYPGWMWWEDLSPGGAPPAAHNPAAHNPAAQVRVRAPAAPLRARPHQGAPVSSLAYLGTCLPLTGREEEGWLEVTLPGSLESAWIEEPQAAFGPLPARGEAVLETVTLLAGTPYLWGGMTRQGIDCSGLVFQCFGLHGRLLPRDADQQALVGAPVAREELCPGDLLFFGGAVDRVDHVGISCGGDRYWDASGARGVGLSRLQPGASSRWLGARRVLPGPSLEPAAGASG